MHAAVICDRCNKTLSRCVCKYNNSINFNGKTTIIDSNIGSGGYVEPKSIEDTNRTCCTNCGHQEAKPVSLGCCMCGRWFSESTWRKLYKIWVGFDKDKFVCPRCIDTVVREQWKRFETHKSVHGGIGDFYIYFDYRLRPE